jgi:hypothetical protein
MGHAFARGATLRPTDRGLFLRIVLIGHVSEADVATQIDEGACLAASGTGEPLLHTTDGFAAIFSASNVLRNVRAEVRL